MEVNGQLPLEHSNNLYLLCFFDHMAAGTVTAKGMSQTILQLSSIAHPASQTDRRIDR